MRTTIRRCCACLVAFALGAAAPAAAEVRYFGLSASVDLPSGLVEGDGGTSTRLSFLDPRGGMELDLLIYSPERFASAEAIAAEVLQTLHSQGERSGFAYQGRQAVIAELSFELAGARRKGHGLFVRDERSGGYALLAHAEEGMYDQSNELIISCLDGFSIDSAARRAPGPVSQFLLPLPVERRGTRTAALPRGPAVLPWSGEEAAHELAIAEREHRILTSYAESRTAWVDAWARFYRMVYRDSAVRLEGLADAFIRSLPPGDPAERARQVLAWVQGFRYERDLAGLDFVPPLAAAFDRRGDCDTRAMVMGVILERMGIDCVLMLSREYSHAMLGIDVPGPGARFGVRGRQYLVAETTAAVALGTIAAAQSDSSKWIGVELGE